VIGVNQLIEFVEGCPSFAVPLACPRVHDFIRQQLIIRSPPPLGTSWGQAGVGDASSVACPERRSF
jgi:hypothetical protein